MALLIGIDEAGYGPLLGPLTVSAAGFRVADDIVGADHWCVLKKAISKEKKALKGRLLVCDSKKAYTRKAGPVHLRRTVLAALKSIEGEYPKVPDTCMEFVRVVCPDCAHRLDGYGWYKNLDEQKLGADEGDVGIASNVFNLCLKENGMELLMLKSVCLDVGYYNQMVENVKNKSRVLFTAIAGLMQQAIGMAKPCEVVQIVVDRQGGRANYRDLLKIMFDGFELSVIRQDENTSSYEMRNGSKVVRVHFVVKADAKCMPVCLGSMTSKYLREVLMESINNYFVGKCDAIKPTAGYWQDGLRFVEDIKTHLPDLKYEHDELVRSR